LKKGLDEITTLKAEAMLELQPSVDSSDLIVEHVNIRSLRKLRRNSSLFNIKVIIFLFLYIFSQLCLRNLRKGHKMIKFNNQNSEYWNVFHKTTQRNLSFDVGTVLRVFELNVKNPAFAQLKNSSNSKGFLRRTNVGTIKLFAWYQYR